MVDYSILMAGKFREIVEVRCKIWRVKGFEHKVKTDFLQKCEHFRKKGIEC